MFKMIGKYQNKNDGCRQGGFTNGECRNYRENK
jgi:hypothetical protein